MKPSSNPSAIHRPQQPRNPSWHFYVVATFCCAILVAGFFFAARQHFSSMEFSLQNSKLRQQVDELATEKRRLLVNREISMSPAALRKAAKRIGFTGTTATQVVSNERPVSETAVQAVKTGSTNPINKVVKTVMTAPTSKPTAIGKQARRESMIVKKDRT